MQEFECGKASIRLLAGSSGGAPSSGSAGAQGTPPARPQPPPVHPPQGNPGIPFQPRWARDFSFPLTWMNTALGELAPSTPDGSTVPETPEVSDIIAVLGVLDLTSLAGDDTVSKVRALARRARNPLPAPLQKALSLPPGKARPAAVCVFPAFLKAVREVLGNSAVRVATVAAGFPHGLSSLEVRLQEVRMSRGLGADEIDVVIRREWALTGKWDRLYDEVRAFREAAEDAVLKVILATGELGEPRRMARAALVAMMAGADFVKTSTGKEITNASLPAGLALAHAIRGYLEATGFAVGLKPAGGIRTVAEALLWRRLAATHLGEPWTRPALFRIGASALLDDLLLSLRQAALTKGSDI